MTNKQPLVDSIIAISRGEHVQTVRVRKNDGPYTVVEPWPSSASIHVPPFMLNLGALTWHVLDHETVAILAKP